MYLLYDHKQVAIPGLGLFTLQRQSANQKAGEQIIIPPSYSIHFQQDSNFFIDDSFIKKLRTYQPSISKKEYLDYANEIINTLEKEKHVALGNLGNIYKSDDNIHFEEDKNVTSLLTQYLPILNLKYFSKPSSVISWLDLKLASLPHTFWTYGLPLVLMGLISLALFKSYHITNIETLKIDKSEIKETPSVIVDSTASNDTLKVMYDKIDSLIDDIEDVQIDSIGTNSNGEVIRRCVIITGAYRSSKYRDLMIDKIKISGYTVYTNEVNGLTRVGLQFECTDATLKSTLEKVRRNITSDAWSLDDKQG